MPCGPASTMHGASNSSHNGVGRSGSRPLRRVWRVIPMRAGGPELLRAASSPGGISAVLEAFRDADVRELLPRVAVPTLVLHRRGDRAVRIAAGRDIASRISGAEFVELDGNDHWFFAGDQRPVREAIRRFTDALPREGKAGR